MLPKNKDEAIALGSKVFFTGIPCVRGHVAARITTGGDRMDCAKRNYAAWKSRNPGVSDARARALDWSRSNPEWKRANGRMRRAVRAGSSGYNDQHQIAAMLQEQHNSCNICSVDISRGYEIDHIMPISRGGSNDIGNIQLLCRRCNRLKAAKHPDDFARDFAWIFKSAVLEAQQIPRRE